MAQILTVCRLGTDWVVRDVTGEYYGRSGDINEAIEYARGLASRTGSQVVLSNSAQEYIRSKGTFDPRSS
ncbi:hypothetical protein FQV39_22655 [Bosea sp. F3-2]|uniref:hypothetical protein n=1 Tax=Bosea sp. F3-2 TaxID=2599640 RepID=UPI0011EDA119|nr:hypothetical protein [Bosea sp. F3-2]QEL25085.1 hypothetical protein FQV39_22655 [Bosea sp. F3-2]